MKIAPGYSQAVVHVLDASRAVGVVGNLLNPELKTRVRAKTQRRLRQRCAHSTRDQKAKPLLQHRRGAPAPHPDRLDSR